MKYLLLILSTSILLSAELEVDGNLKVTGTVESTTIDSLHGQINSLLILISQLEMRIAQLECQNAGIIPEGYCDCYGNTLDICGDCGGTSVNSNDCTDYGLFFDGTNEVIIDSSQNLLTSNSHTIELWVKSSAFSSSGIDHHIVTKDDYDSENNERQWLLAVKDGYIYPHLWTTTQMYGSYVGYASLPNEEWIHIAQVWDGSEFNSYINGNTAGSYSTSGSLAEGNAPIRIGCSYGSQFYYTGMIDNLRLWDRALSPDEFNGNTSNDQLVVFYKFNEGDGNSIIDYSGNGNDAINSGATWVERE